MLDCAYQEDRCRASGVQIEYGAIAIFTLVIWRNGCEQIEPDKSRLDCCSGEVSNLTSVAHG